MGVIDLNIRLTDSWDSFNDNLKSSDSLIYIEPKNYLSDDKPSSIDLTVGEKCFFLKDNKYYDFPEDGIHVKAFTSILVESEQKLGLPYNIFGLVTGKGNKIFQGTFISTGKINPGFNGKLKIGLFNGSDKSITIKKGDPLCTCVFFEMESSMTAPHKSYEDNFQKANYFKTSLQSFKSWSLNNKDVILMITTFTALIFSIVALF